MNDISQKYINQEDLFSKKAAQQKSKKIKSKSDTIEWLITIFVVATIFLYARVRDSTIYYVPPTLYIVFSLIGLAVGFIVLKRNKETNSNRKERLIGVLLSSLFALGGACAGFLIIANILWMNFFLPTSNPHCIERTTVIKKYVSPKNRKGQRNYTITVKFENKEYDTHTFYVTSDFYMQVLEKDEWLLVIQDGFFGIPTIKGTYREKDK